MLVSLYRLPEQHKADLDMFSFSVSKMVDKISAETDMIIMIGDFNIDPFKCEAKSRMLCYLMSVNNMKNIIKGPACFKGDPASMIDLCLVTKSRRFGQMLNYNCGLSDWHNMITVCTKITIAKRKPKEVIYRSYKNFDEVKFMKDIEMIPFHVTEVFDDNDDRYWAYNNLLSNVITVHAPIKKRISAQPDTPQMNSQLRKVMYQKRMSQNKHWHDKNNQRLWDEFRVKRNIYVKQSCMSTINYFKEKCSDGEQTRPFWQTVRPYMSDKGKTHHDICKDDKIVSDPEIVASMFNDYFTTVTNGI